MNVAGYFLNPQNFIPPNQNKTPLIDFHMKTLWKHVTINFNLLNLWHFLRSIILPWGSVVFIMVGKGEEQSPTQVCFSPPSIGHSWENSRNPIITWWQPRVLNLVPVSPQDAEQGPQECQDSNWVCIFTKVSTCNVNLKRCQLGNKNFNSYLIILDFWSFNRYLWMF